MMSHHLEEFVTFVLIFVDLYDQKMIRCVGVSFCCMCVFNLCFCFFVKHYFVPDYQTMLWCDGVSLWYFFMCVFNFSMFLCNIILLVLILFWMIWPIRRCLGVGDLYSSWAGVDPWVDTQCPLITPTPCIFVLYTIHVYVYIRMAPCGLRRADDVWRPRHPQTQGYPGYQPKATQLEPRLEHM